MARRQVVDEKVLTACALRGQIAARQAVSCYEVWNGNAVCRQREAIERLHSLLRTGKASADTAEVVAAATTGKVEGLLVDPHQSQFGMMDAN